MMVSISGDADRTTRLRQRKSGKTPTYSTSGPGSYLVLFRRTQDGWKRSRHAASLDRLPTAGGQ